MHIDFDIFIKCLRLLFFHDLRGSGRGANIYDIDSIDTRVKDAGRFQGTVILSHAELGHKNILSGACLSVPTFSLFDFMLLYMEL